MRRASTATGAMTLAIALYFILFWGFDALRILTSPAYGLEDVWRSQVVFGIGRLVGLGPQGLIKVAAVLGALKLTVAGVCAVYVIDRFRTFFRGKPQNEILETGLLLGVGITVVSLAPAIWSGNADLMREYLIQLLLAALAAVLCLIDRKSRKDEPLVVAEESELEPAVVAPATQGSAFTPWRR